MRHLRTVSVQRAQTDEGPTQDEINNFLVEFLFRWIVALVAVLK